MPTNDQDAADTSPADLETLQAQIDTSLSVANDIVLSWLDPKAYNGPKASSASSFSQQELDSYMRRPARLGVGAPIPESHAESSRQAVKLKGALTSKRKATDVSAANGTGANKTDERMSDEETETKGAKKPMVTPLLFPDPFSGVGKKKKKKQALEKEGPSTETKSAVGPTSAQENSEMAITSPSSSQDLSSKASQFASPSSPLTLVGASPSKLARNSSEGSTSSKKRRRESPGMAQSPADSDTEEEFEAWSGISSHAGSQMMDSMSSSTFGGVRSDDNASMRSSSLMSPPPPPDAGDAAASGQKSRKKRRKRKKKNTMANAES